MFSPLNNNYNKSPKIPPHPSPPKAKLFVRSGNNRGINPNSFVFFFFFFFFFLGGGGGLGDTVAHNCHIKTKCSQQIQITHNNYNYNYQVFHKWQKKNHQMSDGSFFLMLTVSSSYCLLIPKMWTLVVRLGFEKKAFEMASFRSPFRNSVTLVRVVQYTDIMRFIALHNRHHKVSPNLNP